MYIIHFDLSAILGCAAAPKVDDRDSGELGDKLPSSVEVEVSNRDPET